MALNISTQWQDWNISLKEVGQEIPISNEELLLISKNWVPFWETQNFSTPAILWISSSGWILIYFQKQMFVLEKTWAKFIKTNIVAWTKIGTPQWGNAYIEIPGKWKMEFSPVWDWENSVWFQIDSFFADIPNPDIESWEVMSPEEVRFMKQSAVVWSWNSPGIVWVAGEHRILVYIKKSNVQTERIIIVKHQGAFRKKIIPTDTALLKEDAYIFVHAGMERFTFEEVRKVNNFLKENITAESFFSIDSPNTSKTSRVVEWVRARLQKLAA